MVFITKNTSYKENKTIKTHKSFFTKKTIKSRFPS